MEVAKVIKGSCTIESLLFGAVDEMMKQVFGEDAVKVIYESMKNHCHLEREEIAEKPEAFSAGLERLRGSGAQVIEKLILRNLYPKLELKSAEKKGYEFSDYVKELRKRCE